MTTAIKTQEVRCDFMVYTRTEERVCNKLLARMEDNKLVIRCAKCNGDHVLDLGKLLKRQGLAIYKT